MYLMYGLSRAGLYLFILTTPCSWSQLHPLPLMSATTALYKFNLIDKFTVPKVLAFRSGLKIVWVQCNFYCSFAAQLPFPPDSELSLSSLTWFSIVILFCRMFILALVLCFCWLARCWCCSAGFWLWGMYVVDKTVWFFLFLSVDLGGSPTSWGLRPS